MDLSDLRQSYTKGTFDVSDLKSDPFAQFEVWFNEAKDCEIEEPNALCLATVDKEGNPSTRIVLMKYFSEDGLVFFTNYGSQKSEQIQETGVAAANFLWLPLQRQVNMKGTVERLSTEDSKAYFESRPRGSRLGAWVSPQSQVIKDRDFLEERLRDLESRFPGEDIPLPEFWGGYRIRIHSCEFWQGRPNRLHDRFSFRKAEGGAWDVQRLAP